MPTRNVDLTDHYNNFIDASIASGRFRGASEAVRAGLDLPEWLRATAQEAVAALDRGEGIPLSSAEDIDSLVDEVIEEMRAARRTVHA